MKTLFTIDRTKLYYNTDKNIDGNVLGTGPMFLLKKFVSSTYKK